MKSKTVSEEVVESMRRRIAELESLHTREKLTLRRSRTITLTLMEWETLEGKARRDNVSVNGLLGSYARDLAGL